MSLKTIRSGAIVLSLAFCAQFALAAGPVARVNGSDITEAEIAFAEAEVGAEFVGRPRRNVPPDHRQPGLALEGLRRRLRDRDRHGGADPGHRPARPEKR